MGTPSLFPADDPDGPATAPAEADGTTASPTFPALETRSLYRKYRPQTFDDAELVGQEAVVRTLRNAIRLDRVAHAYLFCGPRGTGKTTTARLLAKAVNCQDPDPGRRPCNACANCRAIAAGAATDIVEIDAASNRGIDDIRDLRERVKYAPTQLRVKFYIVDEAHQITGAAANAFLKTLEEPPAHTKFVLATTDPEELLSTIVSRCQRFDFRRIGVEAMVGRLRAVAAAEGLLVADEALAVIARHATGSLRDALGLLDQLALYQGEADERAGAGAPPITADTVRAMLGVSRNDRVEALVAALAERDATAALATVNAAVEAGEDPRQLNRQLVAYLRVLLHQRAGGSPDADGRAKDLAARFELAELAELARRFAETDFKIKHSPYGQLPLEVALVDGVLRGPESGLGAAAVSFVPGDGMTVGPAGTPEAWREPGGRVERDVDVPPRPPSTLLRDRVRGIEGSQAGSRPSQRPTAERPSPPTTSRVDGPSPNANGREAQPTGPAGAAPALSVEQLADLWPRIRQDVKALNRRIEALLSSVDPAAVIGDRITLVTAYEFHRDKLNTDEVRAVVEGAIGRLVGRRVEVDCLLRDELSRLGTAPPETTPDPRDEPTPMKPASRSEGAAAPRAEAMPAADLDADEQRVRAAKNIFDAEEIEPSSSGR